MGKKVGVLLAGCGVYDGTEIHEAVLTLLALDRAGAEVVCMAPDMEQFHVVNHLTREERGGSGTCWWNRRASPGGRSRTLKR